MTPHPLVPTTERLRVLKEVMGRLDHLVEAVYERYKDRYFRDESSYSVQLQATARLKLCCRDLC